MIKSERKMCRSVGKENVSECRKCEINTISINEDAKKGAISPEGNIIDVKLKHNDLIVDSKLILITSKSKANFILQCKFPSS